MQKIVITIMCWNATVSLNTFLFSIGMLCLMIYNNHYTPYKLKGYNIYWYFFILSFCTMQLIEYFLWTHLANKKLNYIFSVIGQCLVGIQPFVSLLLLSDMRLRQIMILLYSIFIGIVFITHEQIFKTSVKNGHLKWSWVPIHTYLYFIWMFFLLFSFVINKYYLAILVSLFLFCITYTTDGTGGSLWCWTINFSMIFYAIYLLIFLPLQELNSC